MKSFLTLSVLLLTGTLFGFAQSEKTTAERKLTPAELSILQAQQAIEKNPRQSEAYDALALALARRARETSDVAFYSQAEKVVQQSLAIAPDNFGALKARAWILLGKHEFAQALEAAQVLNKRKPDDVLVYGFLTDANAELGNYEEAEKSCNWMLKLRPGNIPALTRAAYLRELFGDVRGALELMTMAYQSTPISEVEDRAWTLTQIAHLNLLAGNLKGAEAASQGALKLFPNYHYALGTLAQVREAQNRYAEAVELLRARYEAAPHAENLYATAEALQAAGRNDEAAKAFAGFEAKSLRESSQADNSNHELIFYYADHANNPAEALRVARAELTRRHDVRTLDACAWALYVNGQYDEARQQIERALAVGIQDATLWYHAGAIHSKLGHTDDALHYWRMSAELNSIGSDKSRAMLTSTLSPSTDR